VASIIRRREVIEDIRTSKNGDLAKWKRLKSEKG
jgi:hypothetical protein